MKNILIKYHWLIIFLLATTSLVWQLNSLPLTAYDEAVYAQVSRETLASDQIMTLWYFGQPWFEKPPLYFWLTMGLQNFLGNAEYVYRIISILGVLMTIILTYLLTKKLTNNKIIASGAAIILWLMPFYFLTGRQMRLDFPVIATVLAVILLFIYSWEKPKKLLWILPIVGLGIMFKSVIAILSLPVLIIFSFVYKKWSWLKNKFFWLGALISGVIVLPWHWQQHLAWGNIFWSSYLGSHVVGRFKDGFGMSAINYFDYLPRLWILAQPWWQLFLLVMVVLLVIKLKNKENKIDPLLTSSLFSIIFILILFSLAKTHIPTYLLPAYPFIAISLAIGLHQLWLWQKSKEVRIIFIILLLSVVAYSISLSSGINKNILNKLNFTFDQDFKDIGLMVAQDKNYQNFYYLNWPVAETLSYYANKKTIPIYNLGEQETELIGPFYMMTAEENVPYFFQKDGQIKKEFESLRIRYYQNHFLLLYSPNSLSLTKTD